MPLYKPLDEVESCILGRISEIECQMKSEVIDDLLSEVDMNVSTFKVQYYYWLFFLYI